ncbi:MAG: hypothetical protein JW772_00855, partial [Candidatus Diapherotrites archaeon]|nr:hypothetical protein [Candidatus Diapherotrites archaeon]
SNRVVWQGYKSSNVLTLEYRIGKEIANINLAESINALLNSPLFLIFVASLVIIAGILMVKKNSISEKIENYIVDHSDFAGKEELGNDTETEKFE